MVRFAKDIWVLTIFANAVLWLFLIWKGWYIRYQWLTISTGLAMLVDVLLWACHNISYPWFEVSRLVTFYGIFYLLDILVIWEARHLKDTTVERFVEVQVGLAVCALLLRHEHYLWPAYYLEIFNRFFNLCVILLFVAIFCKESRYEPS